MSRVNARWRKGRQFNRTLVREFFVRKGRVHRRLRWVVTMTITLPEFNREALSLALFGATSAA